MTCTRIKNGIVCHTAEFKPGDLPPYGYIAWHEWAEIQHKAGLRQKQCGRCGKWNFPQQMSGKTTESRYSKTKYGPEIIEQSPVCKKCATDEI